MTGGLRRASAALLTLMLAVTSAGCGGRNGAKNTIKTFRESAACRNLGALLRLQYAWKGGTVFGDSAVAHLAWSQEVLAHLDEVQSSELPSRGELREGLDKYRDDIEAERARMRQLVGRLATAARALEEPLHEATLCEGRSFEHPGLTAEQLSQWKPGWTPPDPTGESRKQTRAKNLEVLRSESCRDSALLWKALEGVDLGSATTVEGMAAHLPSLTLRDEDTAALRDELATKLGDYADLLESLDELLTVDNERHLSRMRLQDDLEEKITKRQRRCLARLQGSSATEGASVQPRKATVLIRPEFSERVSEFAGERAKFGSGVVLRIRGSQGRARLRIVTNRHVMAGARTATVVRADDSRGLDALVKDDEDSDRLAQAELLQTVALEDVAILELDAEAKDTLGVQKGPPIRLAPPREQEPVAAAGFPGIGGRPSFQLSEGTVSNARFGAEKDDEQGALSYIQHTAAIDPGNSGGPLLDQDNQVIGINIAKAADRENVGFAIPSARVLFAAFESSRSRRYSERHAKAACLSIASSLTQDTLSPGEVMRFGTDAIESLESELREQDTLDNSSRVKGGGGLMALRKRLYGAVRAAVDDARGLAPYTTCSNVRPAGEDEFTADLETRDGTTYTMVFTEQRGLLRLAGFEARDQERP